MAVAGLVAQPVALIRAKNHLHWRRLKCYVGRIRARERQSSSDHQRRLQAALFGIPSLAVQVVFATPSSTCALLAVAVRPNVLIGQAAEAAGRLVIMRIVGVRDSPTLRLLASALAFVTARDLTSNLGLGTGLTFKSSAFVRYATRRWP